MRSMKSILTFIMVLLLAVAPAAIAGSGDLAITDYEWRIDGDKDTSSSAEAKPGDSVKLKIEVSNEQDDGDIENVDIEVIVDELNDDVGELEFDDSEDDIRAGRDSTFTFDWDVPLLVDEGTYDVVIKVEGENETNDVEYSDELTLELEIDKSSHQLEFDRVEFLSEQLSCANTAELRYRLYNTGTNDEDIILTVTNTQLGIDYENTFTLEEGDNDDSYRQQTIQLDLPEEKEAGNYIFNVQADYGSNEETEQVTLQIDECEVEVEEEEEPEAQVVVTTPTQPTTQPAQPVVPTAGTQAQAAPITIKSSDDNSMLVVALVAGYIIVIAVIIAMLVALRRKK